MTEISTGIRYTNNTFAKKPQKFNRAVFDKIQKQQSDETKDGKFSAGLAAKNFFTEFTGFITEFAKNPVKSVGIILGLGIATVFVPQAAGLFIALGVVNGAYNLFKGTKNLVSASLNKDWDKAEDSFKNLGSGSSSLLLSVLFARGMTKLRNDSPLTPKDNFFTSSIKSVYTEISHMFSGIKGTMHSNASALFSTIKNKEKSGLSSFIKNRDDVFISRYSKNISAKGYSNFNLSDKSLNYVSQGLKKLAHFSWTYAPAKKAVPHHISVNDN